MKKKLAVPARPEASRSITPPCPDNGLSGCLLAVHNVIAPELKRRGLKLDLMMSGPAANQKLSSDRYRLLPSSNSDSPADAAQEASSACAFLLFYLEAHDDRDRDEGMNLAFTAGLRLAELHAIVMSQPPVATRRSPFFKPAERAWKQWHSNPDNKGSKLKSDALIAEMQAAGVIRKGDTLEFSDKGEIRRIKVRTFANNLTRWKEKFTVRP